MPEMSFLVDIDVPNASGEAVSGAAVPDAAPPIRGQYQGHVSAATRAETGGATCPGGLSDRDRGVLTFEKLHWKHAGSKEQAIRERFGVSASRYYQLLNALIDRPEALEHEPALVKRLRRLRAARRRSRGYGVRPGEG